MEFLYRLYSNNYFGIGLFIVITILAFSFLVILFFGKKDEKTRNKEQKLEKELLSKNQMEVFANESEKGTELPTEINETNENLQETIYENTEKESIKENEENESLQRQEDIFDFFEPNDTENVTFGRFKESEVVEEKQENHFQTPVFSKDREMDLFDSIEEPSPLVSEEKMIGEEELNFELPSVEELPLFEEPEEQNIFSENNVDIDHKKVSVAPIFSSVYINKEEQVPEEEEVAPKPIKPEFELPKTIDLPKRNGENKNNDNIIKF